MFAGRCPYSYHRTISRGIVSLALTGILLNSHRGVQAMASSTCSKLQRQPSLAERVFTSGDEAYRESVQSYWSAQEADVHPSCVVQPQSAGELSAAVKVLAQANLDCNFGSDAQFAVRSGGHQTWAGSANIRDGVTLDLRKLNGIAVSEDNGTVTVGTGTRWGDVYSHLQPMGLSVPGGRVPEPGVVGLTLGGGISYFTSKLGFVCDNVLNFEVVLADGSLVAANQKTNPDLWKALKGGSNNFGIVVAVTFATIKDANLYGGVVIYTYDTMPQQLAELNRVLSEPEVDPSAAIVVSAGYHYEHGKLAYNSLKYTEPLENPEVFKGFLEIPSVMKTMRISNLEGLIQEEGQFSANGLRRLYMTFSFENDLAVLNSTVASWDDYVQHVSAVPGIIFSIIFTPIQPSAVRESAARGGNSLGLTLSKPLHVATIHATWENATDDENVVGTAKRLMADMERQAKVHRVFSPYIYMNYAWAGQQVIDGYGEETKAYLERVSKTYDPHQLFQRGVPGGFKL